jgi:hypothetical protein
VIRDRQLADDEAIRRLNDTVLARPLASPFSLEFVPDAVQGGRGLEVYPPAFG